MFPRAWIDQTEILETKGWAMNKDKTIQLVAETIANEAIGKIRVSLALAGYSQDDQNAAVDIAANYMASLLLPAYIDSDTDWECKDVRR